jgi:3-dehydroquinate dehydratase II
MSKPVFVLNGPNLNLLGVREPHIYGSTTLAEVEAMCQARAKTHKLTVDFRQSNHEGVLIDWLHEARGKAAAVIINPAGYTFTSVALIDALKMFEGPIIELHISNVHKREAMYHHSRVSPVATAVMAGFGVHGYELAVEAVARMLAAKA